MHPLSKDASYAKLWLSRIGFYFVIAIIIIISCIWINSRYNLLHTDVHSARYMLSALIQSEAAIVAIVITLSIVAVQLAASSYSARVIVLFKNNPDFWILIICFCLSIVYGLYVLGNLIEYPKSDFTNLDFHVSITYYIAIFLLISLINYTIKTLDLLKPSTIIEILSKELTFENFNKPGNHAKDPILPISEIVYRSMMRYDYETARIGLKKIGSLDDVLDQICSEKNSKCEEMMINLMKHFRRAGVLSVVGKVGETALFSFYIMKNLHDYGLKAVENNLEKATWWAIMSCGKIGEAATEQKLEFTVWQSVKFLGDVGSKAVEKKMNDATWLATLYLKKVGGAAAENKLEIATLQAARSLKQIGLSSSTNGPEFEKATLHSVISLQQVGLSAKAIPELNDVAIQIDTYIKEIRSKKGIANNASQQIIDESCTKIPYFLHKYFERQGKLK